MFGRLLVVNNEVEYETSFISYNCRYFVSRQLLVNHQDPSISISLTKTACSVDPRRGECQLKAVTPFLLDLPLLSKLPRYIRLAYLVRFFKMRYVL